MPEQEKHISEAEQQNLNDVDASQLVEAVYDYNRQFSVGKMMTDALTGKAKDPEEHARQKHIDLIKTSGQNEQVLERLGLNIDSVHGGSTVFTKDGNKNTAEIGINLKDSGKFLAYLQSLTPENITPSQSESLSYIFNSLIKQLNREYDLDNPDDNRMIELLSSIDQIDQECHRVDPEFNKGLGEAGQKIGEYNNALKGRFLKEYLLVEKNSLLMEIGGQNFGPSKWHTDCRPDVYEDKWENAISVLKKIKTNERASELFTQVKDHLTRSLQYAIDDLSKKIKAGERVGYRRPLMNIADEVFDKLTAV